MPGWAIFFLGASAGSILTWLLMFRPVNRAYNAATATFKRATATYQESMDEMDKSKVIAAGYVDAVKTRACVEHCAIARATESLFHRPQPFH